MQKKERKKERKTKQVREMSFLLFRHGWPKAEVGGQSVEHAKGKKGE